MLESSKADHATGYRLGGLMFFLSAGAIITALGFQHLGGYDPCHLCLMQRYAYYIAMPLLLIAMALTQEKPKLGGFIFLLVAMAFLLNAGLGVYHSGVEWKFWPGPDSCTGGAAALPKTAAEMLEGLENRVVRCDEAAWRFAGLSFAGWNALISFVLFSFGLRAAHAAAKTSQ